MDFSKLRENKVFEKVVFETDNKVAVWEEWQISKQEKDGQVEAAKDRVTVSTSLEDNGKQQGNNGKDPAQNELGMKYELDKSNSLKVEIDEKDDFLGLEHKIEF
jgi:hypothetical protein